MQSRNMYNDPLKNTFYEIRIRNAKFYNPKNELENIKRDIDKFTHIISSDVRNNWPFNCIHISMYHKAFYNYIVSEISFLRNWIIRENKIEYNGYEYKTSEDYLKKIRKIMATFTNVEDYYNKSGCSLMDRIINLFNLMYLRYGI